jgi:hypothetical protein
MGAIERTWTPRANQTLTTLEGETDECADCGAAVPAGDLYCDDC